MFKNRHKRCRLRLASISRWGYGRYREEASDRTETMLFKKVSDTCIWKFTCDGPCQRTHYAGVSTDKCTVRVKKLTALCMQASCCIIITQLLVIVMSHRCPSNSHHHYTPSVFAYRPRRAMCGRLYCLLSGKGDAFGHNNHNNSRKRHNTLYSADISNTHLFGT